jgi:hypothetical protein
LHVGTVIVGGFPPEKEVTIEELGGQNSSSVADPNFPFEQGKPRACLSYLPESFIIFVPANVL